MSLAGTKWVIWHPNPNGITFCTDGTCEYGPYTGTFTEDGANFQAQVNAFPGDPNYLYLQFVGTHAAQDGSGTMTNVCRPGFTPPAVPPVPFTMTKSPT